MCVCPLKVTILMHARITLCWFHPRFLPLILKSRWTTWVMWRLSVCKMFFSGHLVRSPELLVFWWTSAYSILFCTARGEVVYTSGLKVKLFLHGLNFVTGSFPKCSFPKAFSQGTFKTGWLCFHSLCMTIKWLAWEGSRCSLLIT